MNVCWHHCNPNLICSICQHNKPHKARPWKAITEAASNNRTKDEFRSEARQNIWHANGLVALSLPEQNALGHCTSASEPEIRFCPKKWTPRSGKMPRAMKITNLSSFRFRLKKRNCTRHYVNPKQQSTIIKLVKWCPLLDGYGRGNFPRPLGVGFPTLNGGGPDDDDAFSGNK